MKKKLTAIGNSLGVVIERPILELLDIDGDTELEVKTDGEGLTIKPIRKSRQHRIRKSALRMMDVHDEVLKKLAK